MNVRFLVAGLLSFALAFALITPAQAHVETPRLEISLERINPGGVLDLRGVGFDYEEAVTLHLERPGIVVQLGEVAADTDGIFIHIVTLPVDLPEGTYTVRGLTTHHDVLSPVLTVQGPAIVEGGGQGERDEDDGLLAPMPTYPPGFVPGGVSQPAVQAAPRPAPISSPNWLLVALSVLSLLVVFFVFRLRAAKKA